MLEQLRQNSRSFIIWILFGIIIAAFVLTFGTQGGLELRCGAANDNVIMEVDGEEVSVHSWRFGMNTQQEGGTRAQRAQLVLDALLIRELLAQGAKDAGFEISEEQINEQIVKGRMSVFGQQFSAKNLYFRGDAFDYQLLERVAQGWGLSSVDYLLIEQKREILAEMMGGLIKQGTVVSADEAEARFRYENTTATIDAVVFNQSAYQRTLSLSEDDIKKYLAEHDQDVRNKFQEEERLFKGVGEQVKVRQIVFNKTTPTSEGEQSAPGASGKDGAAMALQRLKNGEDFGKVARDVSQDKRTQAKGGSLGWRSMKALGLGAKELTDAIAKLEVGAISEVIETPRGYYILKVEDKRQGDLTYDQVKEEIAERLAAEHYARENARQDALAALEKAKAGKSLDELFQRQEQAAPPSSPGLDPNSPPEGISPEQWQQLLRQLQQQQPSGEQGRLIFESRDIATQSGGQQEGNAPAPAPAPATGNAANPATAPATEPAAGAAAAQDSAAANPAGAAGADTAPAASGTANPAAPSDRPVPKVQKLGPFTRNIDGSVPSLGKSEALVRDVFEKLAEGELAPELYEVDGNFAIVKVIERKYPDMSKFDETKKGELIRVLTRQRGSDKLAEWVKERCEAVASKVEVNANLLAQLFDNDAAAFSYQPCEYASDLVAGSTY